MPKKLREILFKYCVTPLQSGKPPSEQYLGRQLRTKLDALKPPRTEKSSVSESSTRQLSEGDRVQSRSYATNKLSWKYGVVVKKLGQLHYIVQLDDGVLVKRHIDQLCSTGVKTQSAARIRQPKSPLPEQSQDLDHQVVHSARATPCRPTVLPPDEMSSNPSATQSSVAADLPTADQEPPALQNSAASPTQVTPPSSKRRREVDTTPSQLPLRLSKRQRNPPQHFQDYVGH